MAGNFQRKSLGQRQWQYYHHRTFNQLSGNNQLSGSRTSSSSSWAAFSIFTFNFPLFRPSLHNVFAFVPVSIANSLCFAFVIDFQHSLDIFFVRLAALTFSLLKEGIFLYFCFYLSSLLPFVSPFKWLLPGLNVAEFHFKCLYLAWGASISAPFPLAIV